MRAVYSRKTMRGFTLHKGRHLEMLPLCLGKSHLRRKKMLEMLSGNEERGDQVQQ